MGRYLRGTPEQRFWHKVDRRSEDECWEWLGCRSTNHKGEPTYGNLWIDGRMVRVHRFSYELHVGPIPDGLQLDHLCLNKACVNPRHLEAVTQAENMLRGPQIERARAWAAAITHCPHGHAYEGHNVVMDGGKRKCRICRARRLREYRARAKGQ